MMQCCLSLPLFLFYADLEPMNVRKTRHGCSQGIVQVFPSQQCWCSLVLFVGFFPNVPPFMLKSLPNQCSKAVFSALTVTAPEVCSHRHSQLMLQQSRYIFIFVNALLHLLIPRPGSLLKDSYNPTTVCKSNSQFCLLSQGGRLSQSAWFIPMVKTGQKMSPGQSRQPLFLSY